MDKCTFCGSENIRPETPFVELKRNGKYEPIRKYCCLAQEKNQQYAKKHYGPGEAPSAEEIAKW